MEIAIDNNKTKKYPVYKDSGVKWIEDVPSHWELKKFKRVFYEIKKRNNVELNCGSISFGKVVYKDDEKVSNSTKKSYQVVLKGDFLVNPLNLNYDLISLRIALSEIDVVVSSGYIVLNNSVNLDKNYYKYFLHRFDVAYMKLLGSGVRQTLNYNDIATCYLIFPPLKEQTTIAAFLDHKTTLIDQAISIKQKQIELLKERKQILIHKAITKGLNPNVKLKNSGVEWIREIPDSWEVKRLKYVAEIVYGISPNEKTYNDIGEGTVLINGPVEYSETEFGYTRSLKWTTAPVKFAKKGSLLFCLRGSTTGRLNICHQDVAIGRGCAAIMANGNHAFLIMAIMAMKHRIVETFKGSTFPSVTSSDLNNYFVPVPPLMEQQLISIQIENVENKISSAISIKEQEIEKLKEYKATLINSAVTGKIKVN
jgi:type I restriction enzyme, S subunit